MMKLNTLASLRDALREKDGKIVRILNERARLSIEIGRMKNAGGIEVYDPVQERKVHESILAMNEGPLPETALSQIFREIISASRALQNPLVVAYLGPEASFTHLASRSHFGEGASFSPQSSITEVFDEVEKGKADCGVVPVENSSEGAVKETSNRLVSTPLIIRTEIFLRISHALISARKGDENIRLVYPHPQALAQCRTWLRKNHPGAEQIESESTAKAARRALDDAQGAAIGSALAASTYGLIILAEGIEDDPLNTTRFIVIGKGKGEPTGKDKTSIIFRTPHAPGTLNRALEAFAEEGINMNRIESYPAGPGIWEYLFFVDFEGHVSEEKTVRCLEHLKEHTTFTKVLGSYPKGGTS